MDSEGQPFATSRVLAVKTFIFSNHLVQFFSINFFNIYFGRIGRQKMALLCFVLTPTAKGGCQAWLGDFAEIVCENRALLCFILTEANVCCKACFGEILLFLGTHTSISNHYLALLACFDLTPTPCLHTLCAGKYTKCFTARSGSMCSHGIFGTA